MTKGMAAVTAVLAAVLMGCMSSADARPVDSAGVRREPARAAAMRYVVAPAGNAARYRVREQLMGHDLPNDAVGETQQITGAIAVDGNGAVIPAQSRVTVSVASLKSDKDRRDGYVRGRLLETDQYPTVQFVPTAIRGLPAGAAIGTAGTTSPVTFDVVGDLTVRGVTHPTTWRVIARRDGDRVTGSASTRFTFGEFGLSQPRLPFILSVADTIGLEYDFALVRDSSVSR